MPDETPTAAGESPAVASQATLRPADTATPEQGAEPAANSHPQDHYTREQLVGDAETLFGTSDWLAEAALVEAPATLTMDEALEIVREYLQRPVEVDGR